MTGAKKLAHEVSGLHLRGGGERGARADSVLVIVWCCCCSLCGSMSRASCSATRGKACAAGKGWRGEAAILPMEGLLGAEPGWGGGQLSHVAISLSLPGGMNQ